MYSIFFHLLGLALLEILFYFYYIGPFEHNVFIGTFGRSIGGLVEKIDTTESHPEYIFDLKNITKDDDLLLQLEEDANESEKRRIEINSELFNKTMNIWYMALGTFLGIILLYHFSKYYYKRFYKGKPRSQSIEMVNLNTDDTQNYEELEIEPKKKNNKIFLKCISYLFFAGLVLFFEYIFFQYCVLKYHIITDEQIQYLMYKEISDYVSNTYIISR